MKSVNYINFKPLKICFKVKNLFFSISIFSIYILFSACAKEDPSGLLPVEYEMQMGKLLDSVYLQDVVRDKVLDTNVYILPHHYLDSVFGIILTSKSLKRNYFDYNVRIIDDNSLNMISFPGGYFYLNTGLLKHVDNGAELAGIIAHQVAHNDLRHTTGKMEEKFGIDLLLDIILNNNRAEVSNIVSFFSNANGIQYTEGDEIIANENAIKYIIDTDYDPLALYDVFIKLNEAGTSEYTQTHLVDESVLNEIINSWAANDSIPGDLFINEYSDFINTLP